MAIKLFEPTFDVDACLKELRECLEIGWTGMGYKTVALEQSWMQYTGLPHALFLNSCTAALNLSLNIFKQCYHWDDSCEIITTPNTFVSTNHAIIRNRLVPVFADINDTLCLDPTSVERHITEKTKAVIFVGIGGNTGDYEQISALCKAHDLKMILDASHMAGTTLHQKPVGNDADVVCYSFQAVKNLPTGDSGMLCFSEEELDQIARKKCWLGISKDTYTRSNSTEGYQWEYEVEYVGNKYNGNSLMAAVALAQLPHLDLGNVHRKSIAEQYRCLLAPISDRIGFARIPESCQSSSHLFQIIVQHRNELIQYLRSQGIATGVHYISNTRYPMYRYAYDPSMYAEYISDHIVSLPMHLRLTKADVETVAAAIIEFETGKK